MAAQKLHGKRGAILLDSVTIPFKVISPSVSKDMANGTDSDNYDDTSDTLYRAEEAGETGLDLDVEWNYDASTSGTAFLAKMFGDPVVRAVVKGRKSPEIVLIDGDFKLTDLDFDIDVNDMVNGTATLHSYGQFWQGTRPS